MLVIAKVAAVATALAAALLTSAVAHAEPDPAAPEPAPAVDPGAPAVDPGAPAVDPAAPAVDVKAQCESVDYGGIFVTAPPSDGGVTHAECQYIVEGYFYYDNYDNGVYTGTLVYKDGAKVPTERPQIPGPLNVPGGMPMVVFPGQF